MAWVSTCTSTKRGSKWELYDLDTDAEEQNALAEKHGDIVKRLEKAWLDTRTVEDDFKIPFVDGKEEIPAKVEKQKPTKKQGRKPVKKTAK